MPLNGGSWSGTPRDRDMTLSSFAMFSKAIFLGETQQKDRWELWGPEWAIWHQNKTGFPWIHETYSRWTKYSNPYPWVIGHPLPPPNFNVMVSKRCSCSGGLIYFVHSKERTKQENNIDILGAGGCCMYKGLNNSSIYCTGRGGQQECIANGKRHFWIDISTYCMKIWIRWQTCSDVHWTFWIWLYDCFTRMTGVAFAQRAATCQKRSRTANLHGWVQRHPQLQETTILRPMLQPWPAAALPSQPTHPFPPAPWCLGVMKMEGWGHSRLLLRHAPWHHHESTCWSIWRKEMLPAEPRWFLCRWKSTACFSYVWCPLRPRQGAVSRGLWPCLSEHSPGLRSHRWKLGTFAPQRAGPGTNSEKWSQAQFSGHTQLDGSRPKRGTSSPWVGCAGQSSTRAQVCGTHAQSHTTHQREGPGSTSQSW